LSLIFDVSEKIPGQEARVASREGGTPSLFAISPLFQAAIEKKISDSGWTHSLNNFRKIVLSSAKIR
jgi:hypothetical protein